MIEMHGTGVKMINAQQAKLYNTLSQYLVLSSHILAPHGARILVNMCSVL